jgi:hypothetical protein
MQSNTLIVFTVAALLFACVTCVTLINDNDMIQSINADPSNTWKAKVYKKWEGKTLEQMRLMLGTTIPVPETVRFPRYSRRPSVSIPKEFDLRDAFPQCVSLHEVRDQQHCGSCWAFSGAEVLSDRFCIATNGSFNEHLSPEYMVQCDSSNYACQGGYLDRLWKFLGRAGTVTDKCKPYVSGKGNVPKCSTQCDDGSPMKFYKADTNTIKLYDKHNLEAVQEDIMKVCIAFYFPAVNILILLISMEVYRSDLWYIKISSLIHLECTNIRKVDLLEVMQVSQFTIVTKQISYSIYSENCRMGSRCSIWTSILDCCE